MPFSNPVTVASAATDATNPKTLTYNGVPGRIYLLCLGRYLAADSYASVVDNAGNTWTRVDYAPKSGTTGRRIEIWMCKPTVAFTQVIATQNNTGFGTASLVEIQGGTGVVNAANALERSGSTAPAPVTVTPTKANTMVVAIVQANPLTTTQIHQSVGWTPLSSAAEGPKIAYRYNPASGTPVGVSWTLDASNGSGHALVALEEAAASNWFLWDGTTETPLTLDGEWNGSTITPCIFDTVVGAPSEPGPSMLLGMDSPTGLEWSAAVTDYPGIKYTRDFGVGSPTSLSTQTQGKWPALPADATMHVSWKGNVESLSTWLTSLTVPVYLSWYHEPEGDITAATFRSTCTRMVEIVNAHPNKNLILGNGPILTRFNLDEENVNPADWGYPGMTHYGVDCYQDQPTAGAYWLPSKMFDVSFNKILAVYPGIRFWVPEFGITKLNSDSTGSGRAAAIETHVNYLKNRGDVDAAAYFNNQAQFAKYAFTPTSPEGVKYKQLLTA